MHPKHMIDNQGPRTLFSRRNRVQVVRVLVGRGTECGGWWLDRSWSSDIVGDEGRVRVVPKEIVGSGIVSGRGDWLLEQRVRRRVSRHPRTRTEPGDERRETETRNAGLSLITFYFRKNSDRQLPAFSYPEPIPIPEVK